MAAISQLFCAFLYSIVTIIHDTPRQARRQYGRDIWYHDISWQSSVWRIPRCLLETLPGSLQANSKVKARTCKHVQ